MKVLALALAALLSGCAMTDGFVRKEVVIEYKYVVRSASSAQKSLPPYPAALDVDNANQLALAEWIKANEERQLRLVSIIEELVKFYEQPVTKKERDDAALKAAAETAATAPTAPASTPAASKISGRFGG